MCVFQPFTGRKLELYHTVLRSSLSNVVVRTVADVDFIFNSIIRHLIYRAYTENIKAKSGNIAGTYSHGIEFRFENKILYAQLLLYVP